MQLYWDDPIGSRDQVFTVIGGPNGVGKSTYAEGLAARGYPLGEAVNSDAIAAALPGPDATRDVHAGRETLRRTRTLIAGGRTFSRETTLSGSEILRTMPREVFGPDVLLLERPGLNHFDYGIYCA